MASNPAEAVRFARLTGDNSCRFALLGRAGDGRVRRVIDIPHRPTKQWLDALSQQQLHHIVPGMLREADARLYLAALADPASWFDLPHTYKIAKAVVLQVCGVPWWAAVRLSSMAAQDWFLADPVALGRGVDMLALPVRRSLSFLYLLAAEGCKDEAERAALDNDMFRPPDGEQVTWSAQAQASSFAAFRAMNASVQMRAGIIAASPQPTQPAETQ